ncbi:MAG: TetR-like C-terminal domain-containing protein, partial [Candidatus Fimenecus sp.]
YYQLENLTAFNYVYAYFEAGVVGLVRYWLEHPEDGATPEEIATLIENIFWKGASCITESVRNEAQQNG